MRWIWPAGQDRLHPRQTRSARAVSDPGGVATVERAGLPGAWPQPGGGHAPESQHNTEGWQMIERFPEPGEDTWGDGKSGSCASALHRSRCGCFGFGVLWNEQTEARRHRSRGQMSPHANRQSICRSIGQGDRCPRTPTGRASAGRSGTPTGRASAGRSASASIHEAVQHPAGLRHFRQAATGGRVVGAIAEA